MTYLFTVIKYNRRYDVYCYKTICLVKSLSQDPAANTGELSLFYLMHLLYLYHQLFIDIKRENIPCVLDRVSFIVILAMIYPYFYHWNGSVIGMSCILISIVIWQFFFSVILALAAPIWAKTSGNLTLVSMLSVEHLVNIFKLYPSKCNSRKC